MKCAFSAVVLAMFFSQSLVLAGVADRREIPSRKGATYLCRAALNQGAQPVEKRFVFSPVAGGGWMANAERRTQSAADSGIVFSDGSFLQLGLWSNDGLNLKEVIVVHAASTDRDARTLNVSTTLLGRKVVEEAVSAEEKGTSRISLSLLDTRGSNVNSQASAADNILLECHVVERSKY